MIYQHLRFFLVAVFLIALPSFAYASSGGGDAPKPKAAQSKDDVSTIKGGAYAGGEDPIYLNLPPLMIPIINDYGAQQIVAILIDLHIDTLENAEMLRAKDPVLKDALIVAMYEGLSDGTMRNANSLDIPLIKNQIKVTVNEMFEGNPVVSVLIQGVSQRKL